MLGSKSQKKREKKNMIAILAIAKLNVIDIF